MASYLPMNCKGDVGNRILRKFCRFYLLLQLSAFVPVGCIAAGDVDLPLSHLIFTIDSFRNA
jgi:hypothetical protein